MKKLSLTPQSGWLVMSLVTGVVHASEEAYPLKISPQNVNDALRTFANETHTQIFSDGDSLKGKKTEGVSGSYTISEALQKLLAGTGLTYTFTADNAISIKATDDTVTLKPLTVKAKAGVIEDDSYNKSYNRFNSFAGTKTDTPVIETPVNIQIIPKAILNDQQAVTLEKALNNVSGVTLDQGSANNSDQIYMRGFQTNTHFRNGLRVDQQGLSWGKREMANVDRIEVIKGPASVLYGRMEPGGMVNVVTKQPLDTPYYSLQQQIGSYDYYRTSVDATGPITKDNTLLYRANLSYTDSSSFREFVDTDRIFFAPVLKWNLSSRTQATLEMEYRHDNLVNDPMVWPYVDGKFVNIPRSRNLMEYAPVKVEDIFVGLNWSHEFNDNWKLSQRFASQRDDRYVALAMFGRGANLVDGTLLNRRVGGSTADLNTFYTTTDLTGNFDTFGLKHTLLLGGDYYNTENYGIWYNGVPIPAIDIYNPVHTGPVTPPTSSPFSNSTDFYGIYAQDQIKLPYNVHVMGGLRYQGIDQEDKLAHTSTPNVNAVTPRVGILWHPQKWLSVYGNYVENFGATNGQKSDGSLLPPESAQQFEGGIKTEFFDGQLSSTLSYYDLTKQNVATTDLANPLYSVAMGEVHSRGPEFDIKGEILPGWNAVATYANLNVIVTKDNSGLEGNRMYGVPRNMGSVWNTYDFQQENLHGLKVGAGITLRDSSTNPSNTYEVPGFATVDLLTAYNMKLNKSKVTFQLNVNNLLDKNYFQAMTSDLNAASRVTIGTPRTFMGSVKVEF